MAKAERFIVDDKSDSAAKDTEITVLSQDVPIPEGESAAHIFGEMRHHPDQIRELFRDGKYPYRTRIRGGVYERHKEELQVELLKVQNWVKMTGQKIVVICEGRDAAGKGGTIKRFMEHLNPRAARVVALEKAHRTRARPVVFPAIRLSPAHRG